MMFDDLIGQSYSHVGNCFALARTVCARMGVELPAWPDLCVDQAAAEIESRKEFFEQIDTPLPGDLVHVRSWDRRHHVGVVIGDGRMIQATQKHGVHVMRLDHPWVANRIMGFYRYAA